MDSLTINATAMTIVIMALHEVVWVNWSDRLYFADERQTIIPTNTWHRITLARS
jgi:hypothetical protein